MILRFSEFLALRYLCVSKMKSAPSHITSNPLIKVFVLLIAFGVLMIAGSTFTHESQAITKTEQGTDGEEESDDGLKFSIHQAVTHTVQVSVAFQSFLIVVLPELNEVKFEEGASNGLPLVNAKQIRVLFRLIISPNAP